MLSSALLYIYLNFISWQGSLFRIEALLFICCRSKTISDNSLSLCQLTIASGCSVCILMLSIYQTVQKSVKTDQLSYKNKHSFKNKRQVSDTKTTTQTDSNNEKVLHYFTIPFGYGNLTCSGRY